MQIKLAGVLALFAAGTASAGVMDQYDAFEPFGPIATTLDIDGGLATLDIGPGSVSGISQLDVLGDEFSGQVASFSGVAGLGGADVTRIAWGFDATALDPTVLLDLNVAVTNSFGEGVLLRPFDGVPFPGRASASSFASLGGDTDIGLIELELFDLGFALADDGVVEFSFFTSFDSVQGPDIVIHEGFVTVETFPIPAPAGLAALGVVGLWGSNRRRKG